MKTQRTTLVLATLLLALAPALFSLETGSAGATMNPDPTIKDMLTYAIEDEFAARAHYAAIIDHFGAMRPFTNIIRSEETHIDLLLPLFAEMDYDVPDAPAYVDPPASRKAAFELGVAAEIANIDMYESFLARELPEDVRAVFERLTAGSENHLRAFRNGLARYQ